jgi:hypothetical protein
MVDVPDNMSSCLSPFTTIKVVRLEVTLAELSKVFLSIYTGNIIRGLANMSVYVYCSLRYNLFSQHHSKKSKGKKLVGLLRN